MKKPPGVNHTEFENQEAFRGLQKEFKPYNVGMHVSFGMDSQISEKDLFPFNGDILRVKMIGKSLHDGVKVVVEFHASAPVSMIYRLLFLPLQAPNIIMNDGFSIEDGIKTAHFLQILPKLRIEEGCNIGENLVNGPDVKSGNKCKAHY